MESLTEQPRPVTSPVDVLLRSLKVGGLAGIVGLTFGGVRGVTRNYHPVAWALASGSRWTILGTAFWTTRTVILSNQSLFNYFRSVQGLPLQPLTDDELYPSPSKKVQASTTAGGFTGAALAGLRGPQHIIPVTLFFCLFGFVGQKVYNVLDARQLEQQQRELDLDSEGKKKTENWAQWISTLKFSPMKSLSHEEYKTMLSEKKLAVEAEIALIDESIERIRKQAQQEQQQQRQPFQQDEHKKS